MGIKNSIKVPPLGKKTDINPILEEYKSSILGILDFPKQGTEETKKRNKYELEMFSRLGYDYESLELIEKKDFKMAVKNLLETPRYHDATKDSRKEFLEDRKEELPHTFEYQNNNYKQPFLPRKNSLQTFYDTYLKDI